MKTADELLAAIDEKACLAIVADWVRHTRYTQTNGKRALADLRRVLDALEQRFPGHASIATMGRYITTNRQMKRDAMQAFWKKAGIAPVGAKARNPKGDLLAFLQFR
ncbi:MAG: hypothetical protein FJX57_11365 [Alphaproteobacteria bacterium]|nr:hypothetical protein [Alphaproteobacteria bacterium]